MESTSEQLRSRVEAVLDMALSTVSSLHESFTSGVSLLSEESTAPEGMKDKSGSPSAPLGHDTDKRALPAISEDAEHIEDSKETPTKGEDPSVQPSVDTGDGQGDIIAKSGKGSAVEGAQPEEEGDDDEESGTDDDTVLEVHS